MANLVGGARVFEDNTSTVDTAAQHSVGTRACDASGNEYIYAKGVASTAVGTWVTLDEACLTTRAVANGQGRCAVAMAAIVASRWGWYQIYGSASGLALTAFADNAKVYLTSTDGSVDDTDVAADSVIGAIGRSAVNETTFLATFELNYPMVVDIALD